jgi:hypothetical protein
MFAMERTKLKDWVADIKALINKDLRGIPGWGAHTRWAQQFGRGEGVGWGGGMDA